MKLILAEVTRVLFLVILERLSKVFFYWKKIKKMAEEKKQQSAEDSVNFKKLLDKHLIKIPQAGDSIKGEVLSASKSEVKLDINGVLTGVVRGPELYEEDDDYANLQPGDMVEATVIDDENEFGQLELSFRYAGQEKAWAGLRQAYVDKSIIKIKIIDANKGGLLAQYRQIPGFLPVSQLAPENYPRINGGDKGKILDKLKSFAGKEFEVKIITLDEKEEKTIFSEKEAWNEQQKDVIEKYKVGTLVEGEITAVTDFGVFISFGESLEGLIHISELAWQRIDDPSDLYKVGDKIKAEVINVDGSKIFLSSKKLLTDPWQEVAKKYSIGQTIKGTVLKVNPFGLFVKLDDAIHGLAHVTQLGLAPGQKVTEIFKMDEERDFEIVSIEAKNHRMGLSIGSAKKSKKEEKEEKEVEVKETPKEEKVKETKKDDDKKKEESEKKEKVNKKEKKEKKDEVKKEKVTKKK